MRYLTDKTPNGTYKIRSFGEATRMGSSTNYKWEYIYEIIEEDNSMNVLSSMLRRGLDKDMQILYKVGFINGDLELTDKGINALNAICYDAFKDKLVSEAQIELDNDKSTSN